jgi:hypothetical protein
LEEHLVHGVPDIIEFALEPIDEIMQTAAHDFVYIQEFEFGAESTEELFGSIVEVSWSTPGDGQ